MAKEIDIKVVVSNLAQIREQLANLKIGKAGGFDALERLLAAAKSGLKIDVRVNIIGNELKRLLDLQRTGITINVRGAGASDTKFQEALQGSKTHNLRGFDKGYFDRFQGQFIDQTNLGKAFEENQRKIQEYIEKQAKNLSKFNERLDRANKRLTDATFEGLLGGFGDKKAEEARRLGISPNDSRLVNSPSFFQPGRLRDRETSKSLLLTSLIGGPTNALGGLAGAVTFGGTEGVLLGATAAGALAGVVGTLVDRFKSLAQAGIELQRSITNVTGVLFATSTITKNGQPVPLSEQLAIQNFRARGIAKSAQSTLLPFGITGDTAAALTQSTISGLNQKGIGVQEDQLSTILRRFGAAISTLSPGELNPVQIRRTVEDVIAQNPQAQRSEFGSSLKGIAPELFSRKIRGFDDLEKFTRNLEDLAVAFASSNEAAVQLIRVQGLITKATSELGDTLLQALAPGLKAISVVLSDKELLEPLKAFVKRLGEAINLLLLGLSDAALLIQFTEKIKKGDIVGASASLIKLASINAKPKDINNEEFGISQKKIPNGQQAQLNEDIANFSAQGFDNFTFAGQRQERLAREGFLQFRSGNLNELNLEPEETEAKRREIATGFAESRRQRELLPIQEQGAQLQLAKTQQDLANAPIEAAEHLRELSKAVRDATQSVKDFDRQAKLRSLGRQGEIISAAEDVLQSGGTDFDLENLPIELRQQIKGSRFYDENYTGRGSIRFQTAQERLKEAIEKARPERVAIEEADARTQLIDAEARAKRQLAGAPLEDAIKQNSLVEQATILSQRLETTSPELERLTKAAMEAADALLRMAGKDPSSISSENAPYYDPNKLGGKGGIGSISYGGEFSTDADNPANRLKLPLIQNPIQTAIPLGSTDLDLGSSIFGAISGTSGRPTGSNPQGAAFGAGLVESIMGTPKDTVKPIKDGIKEGFKSVFEDYSASARAAKGEPLSKQDIKEAFSSGMTEALSSHFA